MPIHMKTLKKLNNPLLCRRQIAVELVHPGENPTRSTVRELIKDRFKLKDSKTVIVFGMKTMFGGGVTRAFALIYESLPDALRVELKHRKLTNGLMSKDEVPSKLRRKDKKDLKNRRKKVRGIKKAKIMSGKKK